MIWSREGRPRGIVHTTRHHIPLGCIHIWIGVPGRSQRFPVESHIPDLKRWIQPPITSSGCVSQWRPWALTQIERETKKVYRDEVSEKPRKIPRTNLWQATGSVRMRTLVGVEICGMDASGADLSEFLCVLFWRSRPGVQMEEVIFRWTLRTPVNSSPSKRNGLTREQMERSRKRGPMVVVRNVCPHWNISGVLCATGRVGDPTRLSLLLVTPAVLQVH